MSWRTHYGQAFATLWGVQSQSAAISCQASRAVEGQAPQHKASDHRTNLEEPRRALSVTTDRIFVRQKDVPEKQKKKRSSTKPLITLVRCVKNKRSFLRHLDFSWQTHPTAAVFQCCGPQGCLRRFQRRPTDCSRTKRNVCFSHPKALRQAPTEAASSELR